MHRNEACTQVGHGELWEIKWVTIARLVKYLKGENTGLGNYLWHRGSVRRETYSLTCGIFCTC